MAIEDETYATTTLPVCTVPLGSDEEAEFLLEPHQHPKERNHGLLARVLLFDDQQMHSGRSAKAANTLLRHDDQDKRL